MKYSLTLCLIALCLMTQAQEYTFDVSEKHPFGLPNPDAPSQLKEFAPLIGACDCQSISRGKDQKWADTVAMVWRFKYIMNGYAIQDETLKADGLHSGSIRQFNADSAKWYVHYYSSGAAPNTLPAWEGTRTEDGNIRLYRPSKAPNGTPGFYRITFFAISKEGFNWIGEWVNEDETIQYPLWKIFCKKQR